jgi:hypothetical protein
VRGLRRLGHWTNSCRHNEGFGGHKCRFCSSGAVRDATRASGDSSGTCAQNRGSSVLNLASLRDDFAAGIASAYRSSCGGHWLGNW